MKSQLWLQQLSWARKELNSIGLQPSQATGWWRGAVSLGCAAQLTQPPASLWRTGGSPGVCVQLQADRQLAGTSQQHAVTYFPFLAFLFPFPKCGFKMRNHCDQDLPWIKKHQRVEAPRKRMQRKRSEHGWSGFAHRSIENITWCWPHFLFKTQHHPQSCR